MDPRKGNPKSWIMGPWALSINPKKGNKRVGVWIQWPVWI